MKKLNTSLSIRQLKLKVHLGWGEKERNKPQIIFVNIDLAFEKPPKACVTDQLDDTICYDVLITKLNKKIIKKKFRLIEHLSQTIYLFIKTQIPKKTKVVVHLLKYPDIAGLKDGVRFSYGDK